MSQLSKIQWTDATWNPMRGCWPVSPGCANCYAARQAVRHAGDGRPYEGLAKSTTGGPRWTGQGQFLPHLLDWPLRWKGAPEARREGRPSRIFANSMSDLFFEKFSFEEIAAVLGVALASRHTYQILTKRPGRALEFWEWLQSEAEDFPSPADVCVHHASRMMNHSGTPWWGDYRSEWPPQNIWFGVSAENQETLMERAPLLEKLPASIRFLSLEPLLGPVDLEQVPRACFDRRAAIKRCMYGPAAMNEDQADSTIADPYIDWLVIGGESGPGARPCDLAWIRSAVEQCRAAGVPAFVKQLGAKPRRRMSLGELPAEALDAGCAEGFEVIGLRDRKGGDPAEWTEDLRVREFPGGAQ